MASKNPFPNGVDITAMFAGLTQKKAQSLINKLKKFEARVEQGKKASITLTVDGVKQKFTFDPRKGDAANTDVIFTVNGASVSSTLLNAAAVVTGGSTEGTGTTTTPGSTGVTGRTFSLKTDIEVTEGTANNDTFVGVIGTTFQTGDIINGGAGNDTVSLTAIGNSAAANSIVELNSVETVNVRLISDQTLDAALWAGVETVRIASNSLNNQRLDLDNLKIGTKIEVEADVLSVSASYDLAGATSGTAVVEINNSGLMSLDINGGATDLTLLVSGTQAEVTFTATPAIGGTLTLAGQGSFSGDTDTRFSAVNTVGFSSGLIDISLDGVGTLVYTGGSANDIVRIANDLTSADTISGGAGTDEIAAAIGAGSLDNVTGFEIGTFSAAAAVNASFAGYTTLTFSGAGNFGIVGSSLQGATVNLAMASADNVTLGYTNGAATINLNQSADVSYGAIDVSGAATLDLNVQNATATSTLNRFGATGAAGVTIDLSGSSDLTIGDLWIRDAASLGITVDGDNNSLAVNTLRGSGLTSVSVDVNGSAAAVDLAAFAVSGQSLAYTVTVDGAAADVDAGAITGGSGADLTISVAAAKDAVFGSAQNFEATVGTSGTISVSLSAGGSATVSAADFVADTAGTISLIKLDAAAFGDVAMDSAIATTIGSVLISGAQEAAIDVGTLSATTIGNLSIVAGSSADVTLGTAQAGGSIGNVTVAGPGNVTFDGFRASASVGNLSVTNAVVNFGTVSAASVGDVSLGGANAQLTIDASSVGSISVTGTGATVVLTDVTNGVGAVSVAGASAISIDFGNASGIDSISTVGNVSAATINLSAVASDTTVTLGAGTNTLTLSRNDDVVVLQNGTGADTLRFLFTAASDRTISNFQFASAASDVLAFATAAFDLGLGSAAITNNTAGNLDVVNVSAAVTIAINSENNSAATDVIVLTTAGYASGDAMLAALSTLVTAGSNQSAIAAGDLLVVWYNSFEGRTELSLVNTTAASDFLTSAIAGGSATLLATFSGQDIITTLSGDTFLDTFQAF